MGPGRGLGSEPQWEKDARDRFWDELLLCFQFIAVVYLLIVPILVLINLYILN